MTNKSHRVLSSFTRKLANCRHNVSVQNLIDYFEGGRYGYSCEDGIPTVITNDYAFADDIANLVTHIRAIFKNPKIFLKKENIIQNVSVATKMDTQSMQATYRDDKNWKFQDGNPKPELVHTFAYEDNYAIYENRFLCALIDVVYDIVSKKINQLCWSFDTLNKKIKADRTVNFSTAEFLNFAGGKGEIPVLVSNNSPMVSVVGSLIKSKKRLQALQGREMYIQCKKADKFSLKSVKNTNILTYDTDYHFCYDFYLNYLYREPVLTTAKQSYLNFVTVNLFRAITLCGYELADPEATIAVSNSIRLKYEKVAFQNDLFTVSLSQTEDENLAITVRANPDFNESTFIVRVVDEERVETEKLFDDVDEYARALNHNKDVLTTREFLVTNYAPVKTDNGFFVDPGRADALTTLQSVVRACTMLAEGSFYIHSRICPICGSNLVAPDGDDYYCSLCESLYHVFNFGVNNLLWLKQLPEVPESDKVQEEPETQKRPALRLRVRYEGQTPTPAQPIMQDDEDEQVDEALTDTDTFIDRIAEPAEEATESTEEVAETAEVKTEEIAEVDETSEAPAEEVTATTAEPTKAQTEEPAKELKGLHIRGRIQLK